MSNRRASDKSRKSCKTGKRRFRDGAEARRALHRIASRSTRQKTPLRSYFCAMCNGYHLTSQQANNPPQDTNL